MRNLLVSAALLLLASSAALAQQTPCVMPREDLVSPEIRAAVSSSGGRFNYTYTVTNRLNAQQTLVTFAVEAPTTASPVQISPAPWVGRGAIANTRFLMWDTFVEPRGLPPGVAATGFGFDSAGLPSIVRFLAWGDVEVPSVPAGQAPESCEGADVIENSYKGVTVGPKDPAEPFVALEALNHLIALLHESQRLGWIIRDGIHQSMLTKLTMAKRRLEANDVAGARNNVDAFVSEVSGASCTDFDCRGNRPATTEAYALLYFNGQYLLNRLP